MDQNIEGGPEGLGKSTNTNTASYMIRIPQALRSFKTEYQFQTG